MTLTKRVKWNNSSCSGAIYKVKHSTCRSTRDLQFEGSNLKIARELWMLEHFARLLRILPGCSESICIFCCSGAIDLKVGTMVEGMYTGHHAKFQVIRLKTEFFLFIQSDVLLGFSEFARFLRIHLYLQL